VLYNKHLDHETRLVNDQFELGNGYEHSTWALMIFDDAVEFIESSF